MPSRVSGLDELTVSMEGARVSRAIQFPNVVIGADGRRVAVHRDFPCVQNQLPKRFVPAAREVPA